MKITQMFKREKFYEINQKTLEKYFEDGPETTLYIYPRLNAIVSKIPSKRVEGYLLCEYSVRTNILKRLTAGLYVRLCLTSKGRIASKKLNIFANFNDNMLVYPCNKKYRIFDFSKNTVDVLAKDGFPDFDLRHEIAFRSRNELPIFVPRLMRYTNSTYTEIIINGRPLARIRKGFDKFRDGAYKQLCEYRKNYTKKMQGERYLENLNNQIAELTTDKVRNKLLLKSVTKRLSDINTTEEIMISFTHGDLQAGNIWVENGTEKIYIIDWESWGMRSIWYDKAILYDDLRPGGIDLYFKHKVEKIERFIVLLEDIIYQLRELNNLPLNYGEEQFDYYLIQLNRCLRELR